MYTCSICGTSFDGGICPCCRTMRPAAAVITEPRRIYAKKQPLPPAQPEPKPEEMAECEEPAADTATQKEDAADTATKQEDTADTAMPETALPQPAESEPEEVIEPKAADKPQSSTAPTGNSGMLSWARRQERLPSLPVDSEKKGRKEPDAERINAAWRELVKGKAADTAGNPTGGRLPPLPSSAASGRKPGSQ